MTILSDNQRSVKSAFEHLANAFTEYELLDLGRLETDDGTQAAKRERKSDKTAATIANLMLTLRRQTMEEARRANGL